MPTTKVIPGHEQELCEALIRLLEAELGAGRCEVSYPERDLSGPPVEVRLRIGDYRFAIEHTLIEPFPDAIRTGKEYDELVAEIVAALDRTMPRPGSYTLLFPEHPTAGRPRKAHPALRGRIIDWVRTAATELLALAPERLDRDRQPSGFEAQRETNIDGIPVTLVRRFHWAEHGRHDGRLLPYRVVAGDLEERRRARIATALAKKLPKLRACSEKGDETILILEYSDPVLTNQVLIFAALERALRERDDWPDHVFLADTVCDGFWHFFHPLAHGRLDDEMPYIEIQYPIVDREIASR